MVKFELKQIGAAVSTLAISACGASATEPQAPTEEPIAEEAPEAALMDDPATAEPAPSHEAPTNDGEPANREDVQAALQLVLQDEALIQKMDLGVAGRFPVKISGSDIPSGLELTAHEKGAEIVPMPEDPKTDAVLAFTKISMTSTSGILKFRYDVEGLRGTASVEKVDGRWELKSSRVSEYFRKNEE